MHICSPSEITLRVQPNGKSPPPPRIQNGVGFAYRAQISHENSHNSECHNLLTGFLSGYDFDPSLIHTGERRKSATKLREL